MTISTYSTFRYRKFSISIANCFSDLNEETFRKYSQISSSIVQMSYRDNEINMVNSKYV